MISTSQQLQCWRCDEKVTELCFELLAGKDEIDEPLYDDDKFEFLFKTSFGIVEGTKLTLKDGREITLQFDERVYEVLKSMNTLGFSQTEQDSVLKFLEERSLTVH